MEEPVSSYPFRPRQYPGKIPNYSYFLSEEWVHEVRSANNLPLPLAIVDYKGEKIGLSLLLEKLSVEPLEDRYAIIGCGSNACPNRLIEKGIFNLPILKISAKNVDVVYTYDETSYGSVLAIPATIVRSPDSLVEIRVFFLNDEQLEKMDKTEGRRGRYYDLTELKNCQITLPNGRVLSRAYAYVSNKKGIALKDGEPIALASIRSRNRRFRAMYETDILDIIGKCRKGKSVGCLDFSVISLDKLPKKFTNTLYEGIIVDPTVFNDAERLRVFLRSKLSEDYTVAIASEIYFTIADELWEDLSALLSSWEWNVKRDKLTEWHKSPEFHDLCKEVIGLVIPCGQIMEEISNEERQLQQQVSKTIEQGSPRIVDIVKEFITTSIVKKFPVLSFTRHARRWFKTCKNVVIVEISDAKNSVSKAKRGIKMRVDRAGWRGYIFLFIFSLVADRLLETALPQPVGAVIGKTSAGSFLIGVLADGKRI